MVRQMKVVEEEKTSGDPDKVTAVDGLDRFLLKKSCPNSPNAEVDKSPLMSTLARSRAILASFTQTKKQIEAEMSSKSCEEAEAQISSDFKKCHAELEVEGLRVKEVLTEAEGRAMTGRCA